ncbi:MAG TPA: prepilin-type N-terminal cleavage/methylation domain-containing protein [Armatimonadota bacterium]|nr:prepilin-type N-terminal cleavage/methylation domain-containing protein [Armatimonadota bacterium]
MRRRRGLTLLEVLVAMVLGAIVITLASQVFVATLRGRDRIRQSTSNLGALRRAYETISRDMHSASVPPDDSGLQFGLTASPAAGASSVLQLAAVVGDPLLAGRAANETSLVQYAVAEDPVSGQPTLWRHETPYPVPDAASSGGSDDTRSVMLLPGVSGASYAFYSSEQKDWVDSWDGQAGLPTSIRIDLGVMEGNDRSGNPITRQESWVFALPAAKFANDEAAAAAEAAETGVAQ